ncbi:MAG: hypothetical protein J6W64_11540 [Bacilli bacterium]|nr:hypothetical protein [Bacilli bacterium]
MAKLTKEELIAKVNEKLADNSELAIELMEDITDSFEEVDLSGYVEKIIYDELLQKYKDRFLNPEEVKEEIKEEEIVEEPEEKVIDIQEIFEEEEEKE